MSRFFVERDAVDTINGRIKISGDDVKHIRNVLRSMPGDRLELSDGCGTDFDAEIEVMEKDNILARILASKPNRTESPLDITLYQGIPKADKMDFIIQKCVELGVCRIVPVITSRTVVRFDNDRDSASKTARWQRISLEAAKQCDRGVIPDVGEPVRLAEALKNAADNQIKLIPYEEESMGGLRLQLEKAKAEYNLPAEKSGYGDRERLKIAILIGPEGGFEPEEVAKAAENGFTSVTLGPRILRTETAGISVVSIIGYELGDM